MKNTSASLPRRYALATILELALTSDPNCKVEKVNRVFTPFLEWLFTPAGGILTTLTVEAYLPGATSSAQQKPSRILGQRLMAGLGSLGLEFGCLSPPGQSLRVVGNFPGWLGKRSVQGGEYPPVRLPLHPVRPAQMNRDSAVGSAERHACGLAGRDVHFG